MKLPLTVAGIFLFASVAPVPSISAEKWLNAGELEASCDRFLGGSDGDGNGALCLAFLQGFLAGADTTPKALRDAENGEWYDESFSERALRTRLGRLRMMQVRSATDYCIGDDVAALEIVDAVATYLKEHPETLSMTDADAVRQALVSSYPCDE